jgi:hypothetical protein
MNIYFDKDNNIPYIYCHDCDKNIEISELVLRGENGLYCKFCDTPLGYLHDLHPQYQNYIIRE